MSARCATPVSVYMLSLDKFSEVRYRSISLNAHISELEETMVDKENAVALDYVISKKKSKDKTQERAA